MLNSRNISPNWIPEKDSWYRERLSQAGRLAPHLAAGWRIIEKQKTYVDANLYLLHWSRNLDLHDLPVSASDEEIRELAAARAALCERIARDNQRSRGEVLRIQEQIAAPYRITFTSQEAKRYGASGMIARYSCAHWWTRRLRKAAWRAVENMAVALREVNAARSPYCTEYSLQRYKGRQIANARLLASMQAENEEGDTLTLADIAERGTANPVIRRAELMVRIKGFELVADILGHVGLFLTITAPSKYHANSGKYGEYSPREAQRYLSKVWSRIRAALDYRDIKLYGFRVAEPHNDACPHWHLLVFVDPANRATVEEQCRKYALQEDGDEAGAQEARFKVEVILKEKGGAAAYIAKYIAKNIDGQNMGEPDLLGDPMDMDEGQPVGSAAVNAEKIRAWASGHGVRQFQQIGGAPVTLWRELRRLDQTEDDAGLHDAHVQLFDALRANFRLTATELLDRARAAADASDWAAFTLLMGGPTVSRAELRLQVGRWLTDKDEVIDESTGEVQRQKTRYGDEVQPRIFGIVAGPVTALSRPHEWTISRVTDTREPEADSKGRMQREGDIVRLRAGHEVPFGESWLPSSPYAWRMDEESYSEYRERLRSPWPLTWAGASPPALGVL